MEKDREKRERELERQMREYNIVVEILPPGIAIGAIETPMEKYISRMKRIPLRVDGRLIRGYKAMNEGGW